ncbi:MAG: hypothetical protein ABR906_09610 [Terracidiphilus sp.]|jgi:hypothetical protein
MARLRIPLLCFALLAPLVALAANVPEERGAATVSGVYSVTFHLRLASMLPAGSTITCRARIQPNPVGLDPRYPQVAVEPVMGAGLAAVTGSTATCAAEIPFAWTLTSFQGGVVVSYEIDAISSSGGTPMQAPGSAARTVAAAFPASGGSSSLTLNLSF